MRAVVGPCIEHQGCKNPKGYGQVRIGGRSGRTWQAHRWAWAQAHGDPGEMCVLHACDNPSCINVDHLFLGTTADNNADMIAKDRQAKKLTSSQVRMIRRSNNTDASLGRQLGVARSTISLIREGKNWRWL